MPVVATHAGSIARGDTLTPSPSVRDEGEGHDPAAYDSSVSLAVAQAVMQQVERERHAVVHLRWPA